MKRLDSLFSLPALCITGIFALTLFACPMDAAARANKGGGFSRNSIASTGGFSSGGAVVSGSGAVRSASGAGQPSAAGSGRDVGQPRDAGTARGVHQPRDVSSSGGVGQPRAVSSGTGAGEPAMRRSGAAVVKDATPAEMANYRAQFERDNLASGNVSDKQDAGANDWDRPRPVDPAYGVPIQGTAATAAIVGTAIARENAEDYVENGTGSDYYSELPCSLKGNMEVDGSLYYKCSTAWYKRVYRGDAVVYVQVDAPPSP